MGLFKHDYSKEGPGISKNAPKKKAFVVFFETYFRNFWKFVTINLLYIVLNIPILTNGMASVGITNIARNTARDKHSFGVSDFFDTIRKNLKQSIAVGIINTILNALLLFAIWFYYESYSQTGQIFSLVGFGVSLSFAAIFSLMKYYIYTLMMTFDFSVKTLYKNSFKFVFISFWKNLLCGIIILAIYALYIFIGLAFFDPRVWIIEFIIFAVTFPGFKFLLIQFFTFGSIKKYIIDPYYEEHPDADIEKRRDLGLDVPDDGKYDDMSWE